MHGTTKAKVLSFLPAIYFWDTRQRQSKRSWLSLCGFFLKIIVIMFAFQATAEA
jgi:hypothetical protein